MALRRSVKVSSLTVALSRFTHPCWLSAKGEIQSASQRVGLGEKGVLKERNQKGMVSSSFCAADQRSGLPHQLTRFLFFSNSQPTFQSKASADFAVAACCNSSTKRLFCDGSKTNGEPPLSSTTENHHHHQQKAKSTFKGGLLRQLR